MALAYLPLTRPWLQLKRSWLKLVLSLSITSLANGGTFA